MAKKTQTILKEITSDLKLIEEKQDQLEYLVELGQTLDTDPLLVNAPEYRVSGCASNTFVFLRKKNENLLLKSYTDSYVVAGYLAVFERCIHNLPIKDFTQTINEIKIFAEKNNFHISHIPSRADAFSKILQKLESQYENIRKENLSSS